MSEALYTVSATSTGGGRDGHVTTSDNAIDFDVRPPAELGGQGGTPNPESLFASAWATCFNGALQKTMKEAGVSVADHAPTVTSEVSLNKVSDGLVLSGVIRVAFTNVENMEDPQGLVDKAHAFCPYSRAVRGEFDAKVELV